jgi:hypothetical protein
VTRQEPKVDVCDRRYVFNTESKARYVSTAACPVMTTPDDVLAAVRGKQQRDEAQVADLVRRGNLPAVRSFADGSMHPTFASAVRSHQVDDDGVLRSQVATSSGTIPANIRTPPTGERVAVSRATSKTSTGSVSEPVVRTELASAQPSSGGSMFGNLFSSSGSSSGGGMMDRMKSMVGLGGSNSADKAAPAPKAKPAPTKTAKTKPTEKKEPAAKQTATTNPGAIRPKSEPAEPGQQTASTQPAASGQSTINGAAPTVPTGAFDNRFGAWR